MDDKVKFEMEFVVKSSPKLLYSYIATPSGLSEWFADNVNSRGQVFTFMWEDSEEKAKLISKRANQFVRFQWEGDEGSEAYFELRIQIDDITKDVSLIITDFIEEDEIDEAKLLWESQIDDLHAILGG
ncbi:MAG: SRPBCC domain-containing protein [Flavobacteriales bacterium]|nr:SRPBCC domain-containing protein [Flavobacteriales bacterium]